MAGNKDYGDTTPSIEVDKTSARLRRELRCLYVVFVVGGIVLLGFGVLVGFYVAAALNACYRNPTEDTRIGRRLMKSISAINIEEHLRYLSAVPHLAGTSAGTTTAEYVKNTWLEQGLDSAKFVSYNVLLSYPDPDVPNKVSILENGNEIFQSALKEKILRPEDDNPNIVPPFSAYSPKGDAEGHLVYVNYGRQEDFNYIRDTVPEINLNECIVIAKYGRIGRANIVRHAETAGAKGVILYSDPADFAPEGEDNVYPASWWLPGTGVQRGSIISSDGRGDPVTPGYPGKPYMYRIDEEDASLPKIPVHPIGYDDARRFLSEMAGPEVPDEWKGALDITYRIGPGFVNTNRKVKVSVNSNLEQRTIHNVIGMIRGEVEPDRYVILGNHRDAWVYGAVDPSSATAGLLEITRVYGGLIKSGRWRPRRTIIFASWDAEEYGLIGSTEWVEEYRNILDERAVAYINVDLAMGGNYTFFANASPLMYQVVYEATKKIPDPDDIETSIYDGWLAKFPPGFEKPLILDIGSGSDFAPFMLRIGVTALNMLYIPKGAVAGSSYPLYHTSYETFYNIKNHVDLDFTRSQAMARVWAEVSRDLADSVILPMSSVDYADKLVSSIAGLRSLFEARMNQEGIYFDDILSALDNISSNARSFHLEIDQANLQNPFDVRQINDRLMKLERSFIDPLGLPGRKFLRHVVFAPSRMNIYSGASFPGLVDALFEIDSDPNQEERWDLVREQMAIIAYTIQSAANGLASWG